MIQDITPYRFDNSYAPKLPDKDSIVLLFQTDKVLVCEEDWSRGQVRYPVVSELKKAGLQYRYLFCISGTNYFLGMDKEKRNTGFWGNMGFEFIHRGNLRGAIPKHQAFAGITGHQLFRWYNDNIFCGRCGGRLVHDDRQRLLKCGKCGNDIYPRISPGIIVGVIDGDRLLLTKYAGREYKKYALVAGFNEIGESLEETVKREVMEEVGLKVKNIRYYKSQPWANSGTLLSGYYADLDGSPDITLEEEELSEAVWFSREEIRTVNEDFSLTNEMIVNFKEGNI